MSKNHFADHHDVQLSNNLVYNSSLTAHNATEDVTIERWSPWKKSQSKNIKQDAEECHGPVSSIDQFPQDAFTRKYTIVDIYDKLKLN